MGPPKTSDVTTYLTRETSDLLKRYCGSKKRDESLVLDIFRACFSEWCHLILFGFNLLFYGLGSKYAVLNAFLDQSIRPRFAVVTIEGCDAQSTVSTLYLALAPILKLPDIPMNNNAQEALSKALESKPTPLVFVVHSVESLARNDPGVWKIVCDAVAAKQNPVQMIGSVDGPYAPVFLPRSLMGLWIELHTYLPYIRELSVLKRNHRQITAADAAQVLQTLSADASVLVELIAKHYQQRKNSNGNDPGDVPVEDIYQACSKQLLYQSGRRAFFCELKQLQKHGLLKVIRVGGANVIRMTNEESFSQTKGARETS